MNLAEYAERDGIPGGLPIEIDVLAELALKCRSYAKALHYKEREHELGGGGNCIEDLITINRKLDLPGKHSVPLKAILATAVFFVHSNFEITLLQRLHLEF